MIEVSTKIIVPHPPRSKKPIYCCGLSKKMDFKLSGPLKLHIHGLEGSPLCIGPCQRRVGGISVACGYLMRVCHRGAVGEDRCYVAYQLDYRS